MDNDLELINLLERTENAINTKRFALAERSLDELVQKSPDSFETNYLLAQYFIAVEEYHKSLEIIEGLVQSAPNELDLYLLRAEIYLHMKNFAFAETDLLHVLKREPQNEGALYFYGLTLIQAGLTEKAVRIFDLLLKDFPDTSAYMILLNFCKYLETGKKKYFSELIKIYAKDPLDHTFTNLIIVALVEKNDYKSALRLAQINFMNNPGDKDNLNLLLELKTSSHFVFAPHRLIEKVGTLGPMLEWFVFLALIVIAIATGNRVLLWSALIFHFYYVFSYWIFTPLLRLYYRKAGI